MNGVKKLHGTCKNKIGVQTTPEAPSGGNDGIDLVNCHSDVDVKVFESEGRIYVAGIVLRGSHHQSCRCT